MTDEAQPIVNGRYRVERSVGRGGMAEVFLAHDTLLDRPIALKVLFPEYATDPAFVERFRREAQAAAGLQHPHIVAVYDWGKVNNTYFIAMEYVSGKTLAEILKDRKQLTHTQAADIARDVASALGFAHDNGVVHRDIKPGNILVRADGVVKVADFGIARALDSSTDEALTQTGLVMGTAAYLSPEQAQGAQPDPRSDLYSLGVVMYEMVGGRPPYVGDSSLSVAYQHVHAVPEPLKKLNQFVPLEFEAVVAKCMAKSADKRYQSGQALIDDLRRVEEGSDVQALSTLRSTARDESPLTTQAIPVVTPTLSEQPTAEHEVFDNSARRTARYVFGSAVGFVILLAVIVIGIRALTNGGGLVDVPDTVGMQYAQAEQVIIDAGLTPVGNPQPSDGIEPGVVYAQEPGTGERVDTGTRILITYQPTETVTVPAIQGMLIADATELLASVDLTLVISETREDPSIPVNQIISQSPAATTLVAAGSEVTVVVSSGASSLSIPNVQGQTADAATQLLSAEPYVFIVSVVEEASTTVDKGRVTRTEPIIGSALPRGSSITVFVSGASTQVTVPLVEGLTETEARGALNAAGLIWEIKYQNVPAGDASDGRVISQSRQPDDLVDPGSRVVLVVGKVPSS